MSRWHAYLNTGKKIIESYDGRVPLSAWLKDFFRQHKQMGARDRKFISEEVYSFYRLGQPVPGISIEDKILAALFLCHNVSNEMLHFLKPAWNSNIHLSFPGKVAYLQAEDIHWNQENIFPWFDELSNNIDQDNFNQSHLKQPDLFLRIRPEQEDIVQQKLTEAGINFKLAGNCITLANATKIDQVLTIDKEVVVQDYNSQRVGNFFQFNTAGPVTVWDCCAGSGGKSLMAMDLNPQLRLTVSDSRASIIENLRKRFLRAAITHYQSSVTDLTVSGTALPPRLFDAVIADVPCSGSGTWCRTPEQLYFFDRQKLNYYSDLQKNIVSHIIPKLKAGGTLIYITCSVFKKENEEVVDFIKANFGLQLEVVELLKGYNMKADSMFVAVFKKL
jgi:16S rRNA (cytosine967-C5)-methyltransferase